MAPTYETRALLCALTDEEAEAKGRELARHVADHEAAEAALVAEQDEHKATRKQLQKAVTEVAGRVAKAAQEVRTRTVERDVKCCWIFDLDNSRKWLIREDTGAAVLVQKLSDPERQLKIGEQLEKADQAQLDLWSSQLKGEVEKLEKPESEEAIGMDEEG